VSGRRWRQSGAYPQPVAVSEAAFPGWALCAKMGAALWQQLYLHILSRCSVALLVQESNMVWVQW
jgi:hypothetical protein